jgi:hypothetical protein
MKIVELTQGLQIALSNEEAEILEGVSTVRPLSSYTERERVIIKELVRKSCLNKVVHNKTVMVVKNES